MLSIVIPIYNESIHLNRVLTSALSVSNDVCVIDSSSTDQSKEICDMFGVRYFNGDFRSFADKMNYALTQIVFDNDWVLRLDADEYLTTEFIEVVNEFLKGLSAEICGVEVKRRIYFLGKWLKYGDMYPTSHTRITRVNTALYEVRDLDEHVIVQGKRAKFQFDIVEEPLRPLSYWIQKHIGYATVQARMELSERSFGTWRLLSGKAKAYRFIKENFYERFPLFVRPMLYFIYRYIIRFGFLDGFPGFIYAVLHAYCYRFFVDVFMYEAKQK